MAEFSPASARQVLGAAPLFLVADVAGSAAYYRDVLGFGFDKIWGGCFCMPSRDGQIFMLAQVAADQVQPNGLRTGEDHQWDAYVWVRDADVLFAEFTARKVRVAYPPLDKLEYGNREFAVRDLDGYVIAFAHGLANKPKPK